MSGGLQVRDNCLEDQNNKKSRDILQLYSTIDLVFHKIIFSNSVTKKIKFISPDGRK